MRLGQLAGDAQFAGAEHGVGYGKRLAQAILPLKEDKRQGEIGKGGQRFFLIRTAAGKKSQKGERLRRDAAPRQRGHRRARPRHHGHRNPRRPASPDQPITGVGHQRQSGVGHQSQRPAFVQQRQHLVQLALFIMIVKAHEPLGLHLATLTQQTRTAGILRQNKVRLLQHGTGAGRKITRVAKRRRHYP